MIPFKATGRRERTMAQGYYSLEEASRVLGVSADELKQMARRNEVRPFHDRGSMRFRTQEIDELARSMGRSSDSELHLGDAPKPTPHDSPAPRPGKAEPADEPFDFSLSGEESEVELGKEAGPEGGSSRRGPRSPGPRTPGSKPPGAKPPPSSSVRYVPPDSDVVLPLADPGEVAGPGSSARRKSGVAAGPKSGVLKPKSDVPAKKPPAKSDAPKRKTGFGSDPRGDSGVRLVPMGGDVDSDVRIVSDNPDDVVVGDLSPSKEDSDIRLDENRPRPKSGLHKKDDESVQTEEIDLDAELRKAEQNAPPPSSAKSGKSKVRPPVPPLATTSPFELSAEDLPKPKAGGSGPRVAGASGKMRPPTEETTAALPAASDEEVELGELAPGSSLIGASGDSGINLQAPSDSGISLEKSPESDEVEFELKLDDEASASKTPRPSEAAAEENVDSSSEFELTLDDSGLSPVEGEAAAEGDKDIFETDFEMPALEDESSSEAEAPVNASDTDLESSDFDLALGDSDIGAEEESGSQVVALEDEAEADEAAATVARGRRHDAALAEEGVEDLLTDEEVGGEDLETEAPEEDEEEEEVRPRVAAAAAPASWGVFPALFLLPCVIILFLVGLMSYELVQGMNASKQPNGPTAGLTTMVSKMFGEDVGGKE
jgi:hypothetical protein